MDYLNSILVGDYKERAENGVIHYADIREVFLNQIYENPETKAQLEKIVQCPEDLDHISTLFSDLYPSLKQKLIEAGLKVVE